MHVAATNRCAAFSAGDPNFAARSLALKKKKKGKKKKEAEKGSGTKEQGERQSVQSAPHPRPSASLLRRACGHPQRPPARSGPDPKLRGLQGRGVLPGRGRPWGGAAPGTAAAAAVRSQSENLQALLRSAAGQEGRVRPFPAGVHWRLPQASAPCRPPCEPPRAPELAGASGRSRGGGSAFAMLRGPRALAPAAGPPLKGLPAMSPTELWSPGLGSPQLYPVTTTYYTPLYPQIVPPAAAPGTCLDATPHGPEGQAVRCVPAGRLPVILGTPLPTASPCAF